MIPQPLNLIPWSTIFQESLTRKTEYSLVSRHGHVYLMRNPTGDLSPEEVLYEVFLEGTELRVKEVSAYSNPKRNEFRGVAGSLVKFTKDGFSVLTRHNEKLRCEKNTSRVFRIRDKVLLACTDKNHAKIVSPASGDLTEIKNIVTAKGTWTYLIAGNLRGDTLVLIIDPLRGLFREYQITNCVPSDAVCGDSLCIIECGNEEYYAVTFNNVHAIPAGLSPLASCRNSEYYFDMENNLLTRYLNSVLEPLVDIKPQCLTCYDDTDVVLTDSTGTYLLHGNTLFRLTEFPAREIASSKPVITVRAKAGKYLVINASRRVTGEVYAKSCAPTAEGPVMCTTDGGIAILSPFEFFNPKIRVLRDSVDFDGYVIIEIEPWSPGSSYDVKGPVTAVNTVTTDSKAMVALRPRRLGWSGNVVFSVKLPIYHISSNLRITSKEPTLSEVSVIDCAFLKGGYLRRSNFNFKATLEVTITSPVPEEPSLELSCNSLKEYHVKLLKKECTLSNSCKFILEILGYSKNECKIPFEITVRYGRGDAYRVGRSIIDLSNYALENPLSSSELLVNHLNRQTTVVESVKGAKLMVLCSNGYVFEGTGSVTISECLEPLLVTEELVDGDYLWRKEYRLRCSARYIVTGGSSFNVTKAEGREGGIICRSSLIIVPHNLELRVHIDKLQVHSNGSAEILLGLETNVPSLVNVRCGETLTQGFVERKADLLTECSIHDALEGIDVIAIPAGSNKISQHEVRPQEIAQLILQNAVRVARALLDTTLRPKIFEVSNHAQEHN